MSMVPSLPVAALSLSRVEIDDAIAEVDLDDLDDATLAGLVRVRQDLHHAHGWLLLGCIFVALGSIVAVGVTVDSRITFGAYAAAVASGTVSLGFVAERMSLALFRRRARAIGLSNDASSRLFAAAADAEHWLGVLRSCNHTPTDAELASFVRAHE